MGCDTHNMKHLERSIVLAGAAPDTGNHGVTALCQSAVHGLAERGIRDFTIFDNGAATSLHRFREWHPQAHIRSLGFKAGKRVYQSSNMHNIRLRQIFGLSSPALAAIKSADALLDISGGDSFTDLYGAARFEQIVIPKLMALDCGTPLILLPQTYGPFKSSRARDLARRIVQASAMAFARDGNSFQVLKDLLGAQFDTARHRLGVDLAFGLPPTTHCGANHKASIGLNVSGLLWNSDAAKERFSLTADYQAVLLGFCMKFLKEELTDILLVPHVTPSGGTESDVKACKALKARLPQRYWGRIYIEIEAQTPSSLKAVIANTVWFAGSRMHATIAALSSGTPAANLAYSGKALGVFVSCGVGNNVFDLRRLTTEAMIAELYLSFSERGSQANMLKAQLPFLMRRWSYQMDAICGAVTAFSKNREQTYA